MYDSKDELRAAAHRALKRLGYLIESERYGGARVEARKDGKLISIAIRTSANRKVGWMRDEKGQWRAMADADLIVVAAFDSENRPGKIEVFAFGPKDVKSVFDARLVRNLEKNANFKANAPTFASLDPPEKGRSSAGKYLRKHALWQTDFPIHGEANASPALEEKKAGLTIVEAKESLAVTYGVKPEAIEIIIRG
jgi:hypothetical protein